ncbi:VC2046/SO_2500 family protein [Shewanella sp. Isolate11]|uniref:VC2046/SO_2500 family protein n=1 Tax=Shewanella sp. Isolate11 TaxID=2908530 RepID=UPI001EFEB740|nr:VC2046/SO_2500 family protein [Shewanella sp. Isolate11]MCG9696590.1 hypothetical protein [Shewanella sp. Isolate11]
MQSNQLLINEVSLGSRLNLAVSSDRRGEFGLLLAMLSSDMRDMAQFHLQGHKPDAEQKLRDHFELPAAQTLIADMGAKDEVVDNSMTFHQQGLSGFHLQQYLTPEALVTRGELSSDLTQVLDNCDVFTQARHNQSRSIPVKLDQHLHFAEQLLAQRRMAEILV